jgi:very-short-patch-repair endonuclease
LQFRKQHPLGPYILDFYCDAVRLAVEVDGASHGFGDGPGYDARRDRWLLQRGVQTLRLTSRLVLHDVRDATRAIEGFLDEERKPLG